MITEELLKYIENERKSGKDDARIRATLISEGWSEEDLNEGFEKIKNYKNLSLIKIGKILFFINLTILFIAFLFGVVFVNSFLGLFSGTENNSISFGLFGFVLFLITIFISFIIAVYQLFIGVNLIRNKEKFIGFGNLFLSLIVIYIFYYFLF